MLRKIRARLLLFIFIILFLLVCANKTNAVEPLNVSTFVLNGTYSGDKWLTESDEEHWYKLNVPSDGLLEIRIMSYCSGSLYFELWNEDLSMKYEFSSCSDYVSAGSESSPTTGTVSKVVSRGTYYFCLSGTTGKYRLMGSHTSYKTNDISADSYDSPYVYSLGKSITGALTEMDTEDWYKITVPKSGEYTLKLMSYCSDGLDYRLYNSDLSSYYISDSIYGASSASPVSKSETKVLSAGTYYLKIWNTSGKYTMSFNKTTVKKNTVKKKISKLSIKAKKGKKFINVKTIPYAKVTVRYKNKKWKNVSSGSSGKVKFKYKNKLKKGKKVKVVVKKSGYITKKKTVKVK